MSKELQRELCIAVWDFAAKMEDRGEYLPALATTLRILADELADAFPDDTNGGTAAE